MPFHRITPQAMQLMHSAVEDMAVTLFTEAYAKTQSESRKTLLPRDYLHVVRQRSAPPIVPDSILSFEPDDPILD